MPKKTGKPNKRLQAWIDARKRHGLSHAEVQMARELGMNPKKLGKLDNHDQEPWKLPLRQFIRQLYFERFGKESPDVIQTIEEGSPRCGEKGGSAQAKLLRRQSEAAKPEKRQANASAIVRSP